MVTKQYNFGATTILLSAFKTSYAFVQWVVLRLAVLFVCHPALTV